jgi:DNA-directed RNA polymerase subunit RPC12/RpoP
MKILVDNYSIPTAKIACPKCSSVLEIDKSDVKYEIRDFYVVCPLCRQKFYLKTETVKKLIV